MNSETIGGRKRAAGGVSLFLRVLLLLIAAGCDQPQPSQEQSSPAEPTQQGVIVAVGDSLTAGLGVAEAESYPALLESLLRRDGLHYRVVNSGISGETSSGVRSRLDWILRLEPDIVILVTGANDGLRGLDPELVRENISACIERLLEEGVIVVLGGMRMLTNLGPDYVARFNDLYPALAARYPVIFVPFFLEGVAAEPELNQADGIHPNAAGYRVIAANLIPYVRQAITRFEKPAAARIDED